MVGVDLGGVAGWSSFTWVMAERRPWGWHWRPGCLAVSSGRAQAMVAKGARP